MIQWKNCASKACVSSNAFPSLFFRCRKGAEEVQHCKRLLTGFYAIEAAACTPAACRKELEELMSIEKVVGAINDNGVLVDGELVLCCDDNGFHGRNDTRLSYIV